MRDADPPIPRARLAAPEAARGLWPRWGAAGSVLLHAALAGLIVLALWDRKPPSEPLPAPAYELEYADGERGDPGTEDGAVAAPPQPPSPPPGPEAPPDLADQPLERIPAPPLPPPPVVASEPPPVAPPPVVAAEPPPPVAPPDPPAAVATAPPPPTPTPPLVAAPPEAPVEAPVEVAELPLPPPPAPTPPRRPAPTRATPPQRPALPGLYLPDAQPLAPSTARRAPGGADLEASRGRDSVTADLEVVGANVGPDWYNAFAAWVREHWRYPREAIVLGQQGSNRLHLTVSPDGRVREARMVTPSGHVYLDFRSQTLFRGATIPRFPPGADPAGVTVRVRMTYRLVGR